MRDIMHALRRRSAAMSESSSSSETCAICFESSSFQELPCACKLHYCQHCWSRALAASISSCGKAQCPSCRVALRVDYNAEAQRLRFSKEAQSPTLMDWNERLYQKVRPEQIRRLQDFGASQCFPVKRSGPLCACGSVFERLDTRTRTERMLEDAFPGWKARAKNSDELVEKLSSKITCDLCDGVSTRTGFGWTCKNGPRTILHPAAYDICEQCFQQHVDSGQEASAGQNISSEAQANAGLMMNGLMAKTCTSRWFGWVAAALSRQSAMANHSEDNL
jgi:hypothetical protein